MWSRQDMAQYLSQASKIYPWNPRSKEVEEVFNQVIQLQLFVMI